MKFKKALAGFLAVSVLSMQGGAVFANETNDIININDIIPEHEIMLISSNPNSMQQYYGSFTGVVKQIQEFGIVKGSKFVSLESEEGLPANIIISDDTYIVENAEIKEGSIITGFYDANAPMIMIYPPQYNAKVVVVDNKDYSVKVDRFDEDLVSSDNMLKLNISENTKVVTQNGNTFEGELTNKNLAVIYDITTRSIPAQTNPIKVVILEEKIDESEKEQSDRVIFNVSNSEIIVNNTKIDAPKGFTNEQGTVMVPLRAIAETLGFDVQWNGEDRSVRIGKVASLVIDKDEYTYVKTSHIQLGTAPVIINDKTFVPLSFFKEVLKINDTQVIES